MKKIIIFFVIIYLFFANGCKDDEFRETYLRATETEIANVSKDGETIELHVISSGEWNVSNDLEWISFDPQVGLASKGGQILRVVVSANSGTELREGTFSIENSDKSEPVVITVSQQGITPLLSVTPLSFNLIPGDGSVETFNLVSNLIWEVSSNVDWITFAVASGSASENGQDVSFTILANTETQPREGTITVTNGSLSQDISVNQLEAGSSYAGVYYSIDLSKINFLESYVYYVKADGTNIAMITQEYLGQVTDQQAVMVYAISDDGLVSDNVLAANVKLFNNGGSYSKPSDDVHGGIFSFTEGAYLTEGVSPEVSTVYIHVYNGVEWVLTLPDEIEVTPLTPEPYTLTIDDYEYKLVKVGDQYWTAENVKSSIDNTGTNISSVVTDETFTDEEKSLWISGNPVYAKHSECGYIYNWFAATIIAPDGWRLPSAFEQTSDWSILIQYVGTSTKSYVTEELGGTNISLFSVAHGSRVNSGGGYNTGDYLFWSSTEESTSKAYFTRIRITDESVVSGDGIRTSKYLGAGVRLVKE